MDTSWIKLSNDNPVYKDGVIKFIELAKENLIEGKTRCPCKNCQVKKWLTIDEVESHLIFKGFYKDYDNWIYHGKGDVLPRMLGIHVGSTSQGSLDDPSRVVGRDDMGGLLSAAFGVNIPHPTSDPINEMSNEPQGEKGELDEIFEEPNLFNQYSSPQPQSSPPHIDVEEETKYKKLLEAADEALYVGCTSFSKLSFTLHLFHLKCMYHWSAESFTMLLKFLVDAFPQIKEFPQSYYDGKKMINDLGLGYEKIDACPNNCILYWGDLPKEEKCHVCNAPRRKAVEGKNVKKGEPLKVMRYFPLIPRLKRIYMSSKTAEDMRWHDKDRVKDGKLRHPADGDAWKQFDSLYPEFSSDPRSVRLALASDGFNPYRVMNTTYSTWPVVLIPYNLPPWLCMKSSSLILSILIPGKSGPGIDIDVYLQPLLHELKLLWEGVAAFDAYAQQWFNLRAALRCTINDFPAYAMLSGWSTKGYNACPICTNSTHSYRFAGKICYLGHRKWLPIDHPFRGQSDLFDGSEEYGLAPIPTSGTEIMRQQEGVNYVYGKSKTHLSKKRVRRQEREDDNNDGAIWSKRSIFFDLPYWEHNPLRHNLDVMHIEKNVCDILLGTLLDLDKKCRDDENTRKAIQEIGIRKHLWLQSRPNQAPYMPPASYSMSIEEKNRFLRVLQKLKVPDGYGSNISRCVSIKDRKLSNLKSHDNHVLMQDILPIALRASKATKVIDLLSDLSAFFKYVCSTTLDPKELDDAQSKLVLTLCEMEKEFLPTFFTIMVHLIIHLVEEIKLGGPVHYRWMYPIERYLAHLKAHVSNKAQPEGSIAEGYLLRETITFCSRYLESVETIFNRPKRNDDYASNMVMYLYSSGGRVLSKQTIIRLDAKSLEQAHRYVLLHSDEMKDLFDEFLLQKQQEHRGIQIDESVQNEWIIKEFSGWLQNQVHHIDESSDERKLRKSLAGGLSIYAKRMSAFVVNGYKFHTVDRDRSRKTQNSGVMVEADGQAYYGKLTHIYEVDYYGAYKVVIFRCDWVDINRGVKTYANGGACVNFSKLMHTGRHLGDDPFVFSSQAKQVFYVQDEIQKGWLHVIKTKPRDLFDLGDVMS